jgi:hypothetical protein
MLENTEMTILNNGTNSTNSETKLHENKYGTNNYNESGLKAEPSIRFDDA